MYSLQETDTTKHNKQNRCFEQGINGQKVNNSVENKHKSMRVWQKLCNKEQSCIL